jgi:glycosyltransferase involved in cell wall biosynthesis
VNIGMFRHPHEQFGGSVYARMVASALATRHELTLCDVPPPRVACGVRPQALFSIYRQQRRCEPDIWIREYLAVAAMQYYAGRSKHIALVYHIDHSECGKWLVSRMIYRRFLSRATNCEATVVIAPYWKTYLESIGVQRVVMIPNGFDLRRFDYSRTDVARFKARHALDDKPIIYLGNCQTRKGVRDAYECLKGLNVQLVTSGVSDTTLPIRSFRLSYSDYILLLASSSVVLTMSRFLEGWNRTAHEAMLCKTPVVGSGTGGMGDLLRGGKQIVCESLRDLRTCVAHAMEHSVSIGECGYRYASQFSEEAFADAWRGLVERVVG